MADASPALDLGTFLVSHVMIHEIPKVNIAQKSAVEPVITDACINLTDPLKRYLRERITDSLARHKFAAVYDPPPEPAGESAEDDGEAPVPPRRRDERSDVPKLVLQFFSSNGDDLIPLSQEMARCLYKMQEGSASEGMLVVVDGTIGTGKDSGKCLAILKLEKSDALTVTPATNAAGKSTFEVEIHDITLKRDAKVFKAALFRRTTVLSDLQPWVSDNQRDETVFGPDVATFFLRFLGCTLRDTADRQTKKYVEYVKRFVNEQVDDEEVRANIMIAAMVDISGNSSIINPTEFAENHMTPELQDRFLGQLRAEDGSVGSIAKDRSLIGTRLDRVVARFDGDITVTGPRAAVDQALSRDADGNWRIEAHLKSIGPKGG